MTNKTKDAIEALTRFSKTLYDIGVTFEQLIKVVNQKQQEEEKPWPQRCDEYWCIHGDGYIEHGVFDDDTYPAKHALLGNVYKTKEQAEQIAKNRRIHTMLKELAGGFEPDWEDVNQPKHFLCWGYRKAKEDVDFALRWQTPNTVYFKTEEEGQKAIQTVTEKFGDDAIKKYCLDGVI